MHNAHWCTYTIFDLVFVDWLMQATNFSFLFIILCCIETIQIKILYIDKSRVLCVLHIFASSFLFSCYINKKVASRKNGRRKVFHSILIEECILLSVSKSRILTWKSIFGYSKDFRSTISFDREYRMKHQQHNANGIFAVLLVNPIDVRNRKNWEKLGKTNEHERK